MNTQNTAVICQAHLVEYNVLECGAGENVLYFSILKSNNINEHERNECLTQKSMFYVEKRS